VKGRNKNSANRGNRSNNLGGTIMAVDGWSWERAGCDGHPKIIRPIQIWTGLTILGCPTKKRWKKHNKWWSHQQSIRAKNTQKRALITNKWQSVSVSQQWRGHSHSKPGRTGMKWGWMGHHSASTSVGKSHNRILLVILLASHKANLFDILQWLSIYNAMAVNM
jgi:hypothetical protein